jgi:hypothetical protein
MKTYLKRGGGWGEDYRVLVIPLQEGFYHNCNVARLAGQ